MTTTDTIAAIVWAIAHASLIIAGIRNRIADIAEEGAL